MQLRLGVQSRTTKDIDLLSKELEENVFDSLVEAGSMDLSDWFVSEVGQTVEEPEDDFGGYRYQVVSQIDGRIFEQFHVDVGVSDRLIEEHDFLYFDPILEFAGIAATSVPCYPITQQIAEKLHALTREYSSGSSSRGKDFVGILLLASFGTIDGTLLSRAIVSTFQLRGTHPIPHSMPSLEKTIQREYTRISGEVDLPFEDFYTAKDAMVAFINPLLKSKNPGNWNSKIWEWE